MEGGGILTRCEGGLLFSIVFLFSMTEGARVIRCCLVV